MVGQLLRRVARRAGWRRATAERIRQLTSRGPVRLHLGSGGSSWPGWINVDADPRSNADVVVDFRRIGSLFEAGTVDAIAMIHSISYLNLWEARDLFVSARRLLRPGGTFELEFPDVGKCASAVLAAADSPEPLIEAIRGFYAFDLGQVKRRESYVPYAFGWTAAHLALELRAAGFSTVFAGDPRHHEQRGWRDSRVEARR